MSSGIIPVTTSNYTDSSEITLSMVGGVSRFENIVNAELIKLTLSNVDELLGSKIPDVRVTGESSNYFLSVGVPSDGTSDAMELELTLTVKCRKLPASSPLIPDDEREMLQRNMSSAMPTEIVRLDFNKLPSDTVPTIREAFGKPITVYGGASLDEEVFKYGNASLMLNGNGISVPVDNGDISFGDFTIEGWFDPQSTRANQVLCSQWQELGDKVFYLLASPVNGLVDFFFYPYSETDPILSGGTLQPNQWSHVAVCRKGNRFRLFVDGILQDSVEFDEIRSPKSVPLLIGNTFRGVNTFGSSYYRGFTGNVDSFRIVRFKALYANNFVPGDFVNIGD